MHQRMLPWKASEKHGKRRLEKNRYQILFRNKTNKKIVGHEKDRRFFAENYVSAKQKEVIRLIVLMLCQEVVDTVGRIQQIADGTVMV